MANISPGIFKAYDIRGIYGEEITEENSVLIGKGTGTFFLQNGVHKVFIGHDNRVSNPSIYNSFIEGVRNTGCNVVGFGLSLTQFMYFSWYKLDAEATVIVTASHNPAKFIGFKISMKGKPLITDSYQEIMKICQTGSFSEGRGQLESYNIFPAYKEEILKNIQLAKPVRVAVDCGNGTTGNFAPEILTEIGCEVIPIFCQSDGRFPNHDPYPQKVEYYGELIKILKSGKADIGLSFDGDGDRLGVYDEKGNYLEGDRLAMIIVDSLSGKIKSPKIVMSVNTTLAVIDYIRAKGVEFFFSKTGYPFTTRKMDEVGAIFGGEISGHFHFRDRYYGYDDGIYAACRVLEIITRKNLPFSALVAPLPRYFETKEIRIKLPVDIDKFKLTQALAEEFKIENPDWQVLEIDGFRFSFPDGWFLIRPSNTEQLIGIRAEAKNESRLAEIKNIVNSKFKKNNLVIEW